MQLLFPVVELSIIKKLFFFRITESSFTKCWCYQWSQGTDIVQMVGRHCLSSLIRNTRRPIFHVLWLFSKTGNLIFLSSVKNQNENNSVAYNTCHIQVACVFLIPQPRLKGLPIFSIWCSCDGIMQRLVNSEAYMCFIHILLTKSSHMPKCNINAVGKIPLIEGTRDNVARGWDVTEKEQNNCYSNKI